MRDIARDYMWPCVPVVSAGGCDEVPDVSVVVGATVSVAVPLPCVCGGGAAVFVLLSIGAGCGVGRGRGRGGGVVANVPAIVPD